MHREDVRYPLKERTKTQVLRKASSWEGKQEEEETESRQRPSHRVRKNQDSPGATEVGAESLGKEEEVRAR